MGANELEVFWNALDGIDLKPARDPAQNRSAFVMAEIVARLRPDIGQHFRHGRFVLRVVGLIGNCRAARRVLDLRVRLIRVGNSRRQPHPVLVPGELR